jgi:Putative transmembrane protein (PGPGW)
MMTIACDVHDDNPPAKKSALVDTIRKGAVAVTGGTLTVVGLVMIPLPTPMGCAVAAAGMTLLGTEFEAANRILAAAQESVVAVRDKWREPKSGTQQQQQRQQHDNSTMKRDSELALSGDKDIANKDDNDSSFLSKNVYEPIRSARETWLLQKTQPLPGACCSYRPDDSNARVEGAPA